MNKDLYATIRCTKNQMFYADIKHDVFSDRSYLETIGGCQDFTQAGVLHYLHGHGVPYDNITVEVNGYSVRHNPAWGTWQTSHPEIAATVGEYTLLKDAIQDCKNG